MDTMQGVKSPAGRGDFKLTELFGLVLMEIAWSLGKVCPEGYVERQWALSVWVQRLVSFWRDREIEKSN